MSRLNTSTHFWQLHRKKLNFCNLKSSSSEHVMRAFLGLFQPFYSCLNVSPYRSLQNAWFWRYTCITETCENLCCSRTELQLTFMCRAICWKRQGPLLASKLRCLSHQVTQISLVIGFNFTRYFRSFFLGVCFYLCKWSFLLLCIYT